MKKEQFDALSESLSKAINPAARKRDATARILEQIEPLPIFGRQIPTLSSSEDSLLIDATGAGVKSTPVSVNTVSNLTPVPEKQGYPEAKRSGYLKIPHDILDTILPRLEPSEAVVFLRLYRLSVGFNQRTCTVGMSTLMRVSNLSESCCRRALRRLMELGVIRQLGVLNTREVKGTTYQINTGVDLKPVSIPDRC